MSRKLTCASREDLRFSPKLHRETETSGGTCLVTSCSYSPYWSLVLLELLQEEVRGSNRSSCSWKRWKALVEGWGWWGLRLMWGGCMVSNRAGGMSGSSRISMWVMGRTRMNRDWATSRTSPSLEFLRAGTKARGLEDIPDYQQEDVK